MQVRRQRDAWLSRRAIISVSLSQRSTHTQRALKGSGLLFVALMLGNILNYGYTLALSRVFGPEMYGQYASFVSLFLLITLLPMTFQQVSAKYAAQGHVVLPYMMRLALISGLALAGIMLASASVLEPMINLSALWLIGLGLSMPVYNLLGVLRGGAQGLERFLHLSKNLVLEPACKIALTPLAVLIIPGAGGAVLATLLALPCACLQLLKLLGNRTHQLSKEVRRNLHRDLGPMFANLGGQAVIVNSDVLLVNAIMPEVAGVYAGVALIGRVIFYGSWAIGMATFPIVANLTQESQEQTSKDPQAVAKQKNSLLWFAFGSVGFVCGCATLLCLAYPQLITQILLGKAYLSSAPLLAIYALMTSLYALSNVITNHYLALSKNVVSYLTLLGAGVQVLLMVQMQQSPMTIIAAQVIAKGALLVALLALHFYFTRRSPSAS